MGGKCLSFCSNHLSTVFGIMYVSTRLIQQLNNNFVNLFPRNNFHKNEYIPTDDANWLVLSHHWNVLPLAFNVKHFLVTSRSSSNYECICSHKKSLFLFLKRFHINCLTICCETYGNVTSIQP